MILFVFEGGKGEPKIFDSIEKLFLSRKVTRDRYEVNPTLWR